MNAHTCAYLPSVNRSPRDNQLSLLLYRTLWSSGPYGWRVWSTPFFSHMKEPQSIPKRPDSFCSNGPSTGKLIVAGICFVPPILLPFYICTIAGIAQHVHCNMVHSQTIIYVFQINYCLAAAKMIVINVFIRDDGI